jgi:thiosulfate dehydrogenase
MRALSRRTRAGASIGIVLAALLSLPAAVRPASAQEDAELQQLYSFGRPTAPTEAWLLALGGRLYDNWAETLRIAPPDTAHPAHSDSGAITAAASWRCVSCHGWDYRGADGPSAARTPIVESVGIDGAAGRDPVVIAGQLRAPPHGYGPELIGDEALASLSLFVSRGQHDPAGAIDRASGLARGDAAHGAAIFQNLCAICHAYDGLAQITGEPGDEPSLGAVARRNPWQVLHKIRNGQPGADMPALRAFDLGTALDLLAYLQTLPGPR